MKVTLDISDKNLFLKRLTISDASFLTLREKLLLESHLIKNPQLDVWKMSLVDISKVISRPLTRCTWNGKNACQKALNAFNLIDALKIKAVHYESPDFPAMLREMKDPPYMIFYRGNLDVLKKTCVSVVGTRRATPSAVKAAREFSMDACEDGWCVVSGLAFGIDAASHLGAVMSSKKGATCAVLPGGIDSITPKSNTMLARRILENGGLILSEYVPGTPAASFRFVQRNRIVAALSSAVVVIQSPPGSGAMITAGLALDYNRDVFFHKCAFSPESKKLAEVSTRILKNLVAQGKKVEYKLNSCPEKFVEDGAAVIESFDQFKNLRSDGAFVKKETESSLLFSGEI